MTAPSIFEVDAIAFDLDGTLLDTIHDLAAALNRLLADVGLPPLPKPVIRDLVGKGMANLIARALELARGTAPATGEVDALMPRYQAHYAEALGRETVAFPGVIDALERLRARDFALAVVTNKASRFVRPHLEHAGIARHFAALVGGDDAPAKKPDAAPLLLAAEQMRVVPARLLMVGDSVNDVDAARAAGCPVLLVPYGYSEGTPVRSLAGDGIVTTLAELPDRVRRGPTNSFAT